MSGHSKWANIKHKKGKADALRGKITTKISREITIAVRMGGADPTGNMKLKLALTKAKANNIPKDNIQRAIQKGAGALEGQSFEEITYEGYGPAGVAMMVSCLTDNRNRTAADVRHVFSKHGGNLGATGCVGYMFQQKGIFAVSKESGVEEDDLMMLALEAGAEDIKNEEEGYEIVTAPEAFDDVEKALADAGIEVEMAEITMIPDTMAELSAEDAEKVQKMLDVLEELDDVQDVYHNANLPDDDEE
ncbi:YebC/PmpR family DNA-binding transcriptional regulator [uncultured Phascolarctobacterium sp.]|uniref:YebC/PmpR family DNA-binding transcriptional regulator n=1 Tax=uncultured Phascolarctobacterium sp. TaxID=512296 RepID=UPI00260A733F|nr:YebC/PmpR family DNA-binding transcriptional regulator [uncultured Phascolarctobacterium sp.]